MQGIIIMVLTLERNEIQMLQPMLILETHDAKMMTSWIVNF